MDRQGRGGGPRRGADRLCRDPVPRPRRAARPQARRRVLPAAADKGAATAQNRLARCYAHGAGVQQNLVEAAKWNFIAKAGGIDDEVLEKMLAKLSRADRAKAQTAAERWRDRAMVGLE